jgi:hypothetical protein
MFFRKNPVFTTQTNAGAERGKPGARRPKKRRLPQQVTELEQEL